MNTDTQTVRNINAKSSFPLGQALKLGYLKQGTAGVYVTTVGGRIVPAGVTEVTVRINTGEVLSV